MSTSIVGVLKIKTLAKEVEKSFLKEEIIEHRQAASRLLNNTNRVVSLAEEIEKADTYHQSIDGRILKTRGRDE